MPRVVYAPERITRPLLRTGERGGGSFEEVSWGRALAVVAAGLEGIRERHGSESIVLLGGSGACRGALHNTGAVPRRFFAAWCATSSPPSAICLPQGNFSSQASMHANSFLFGTQEAGIDAATIRHARLVLLWGANLADTRFGAEWESRLRDLVRRKVPVVVIDPRKSRTARLYGSEWIPVLPGTDSALMASMLYVLLEQDLVDRVSLDSYAVGFGAIEGYVRGSCDGVAKDPSWGEGICGVPARRIRDLALLYGRTRPAALIPGLSTQRAIGGEESCRLAVALQVATGNAGRPGGSSGACVWGRLPGPRCGRLAATPSGAESPPRSAGFPVYQWADAVLLGRRGGYPADIKAIYNVGGNYIAQGSTVRKSLAAFRSVELAVCHELFLTPTALMCDVVLPVTTFLEREDIVFPAGNFLCYSNRAIPPVGQCRDDFGIFGDLAERMGFGPAFTEGRTEAEWLERFLERSDVPDADPRAHPLATPSGRIELSSDGYAASGFPPFPTVRAAVPAPEYPFRLVTPHSRYYVNSQGSNIDWLSDRQGSSLSMNPEDARRYGIADGCVAVLESPWGVCRVTVSVTDDIMPGVVCLPVGRWPVLAADGVEVNGAPNAVTSTVPTLPSHGARTHSTSVRVRPAQSPRVRPDP
jgi:anaerobic dimethyl sulfoxide reductase subunit A